MALIFVDDPEPTPPPFALRAHHCGISVPDLETSIRWYRDMLGFAVEMRTEVPEVPFRGAFLRRGDTRIELFEVPGATALPAERRDPQLDVRTHGTKHLSLEVSDLRGAFAFLTSHGVEVAMDIFESDGFAGGYIRDNAGTLIELVQHLDARARI
jgi:methylmalonyl-CoA/ethylmalonyl-CoA epimerase